MARECIELLNPARYRADERNFLLAEARLALPNEMLDEAFQLACGLVDLDESPHSCAALALEEAALMEGRTSRHHVAGTTALADAQQLTARFGAIGFDCVVNLSSDKPPPSPPQAPAAPPGRMDRRRRESI